MGEDFGLPAAQKRHTMSHAPEHIPEIESPIRRRKPEKPESKTSISPIKTKKRVGFIVCSRILWCFWWLMPLSRQWVFWIFPGSHLGSEYWFQIFFWIMSDVNTCSYLKLVLLWISSIFDQIVWFISFCILHLFTLIIFLKIRMR